MTSYTWHDMGASQGYEEAARRRDMIQKKMAHVQMTKAKKLGKEMVGQSKKNLR